jgi:hypothetical protein
MDLGVAILTECYGIRRRSHYVSAYYARGDRGDRPSSSESGQDETAHFHAQTPSLIQDYEPVIDRPRRTTARDFGDRDTGI